jgi:outer membrane protein OmpA-like peptidoglycan-associated protein
LFSIGLTSQAVAQGAPPAPAPTYYMPGAPAPAPAPPPPAAPPAAEAPAPAPAPAPAAGASAGWSFAGGGDAYATAAPAAAAEPETSAEQRIAWRKESLKAQNNVYGSTGLLRLSEAGSGMPGTFRVGILTDWFTKTNFLCIDSQNCPGGKTGDKASHFGATMSLSVTPTSYLEVFASIRSYANSNDQGRPKLLQVLGDTVLGLKGFTPAEPGDVFRFGAEAQLLLVNGTGGVGLNGSGTGFRIRGLGTADLTGRNNDGTPLRIHMNLGYHLDNTGQVVKDTETARGNHPITRIERFGLGINRVDFVETGLGVEGMFDLFRPFLSYSMDIPVNRQDYKCVEGDPVTVGFQDKCLGRDPGVGYFPSRLTIGTRAFPYKGLAPIAAFDIGITGTSKFMEEVAPTPPWTLWLGLGYSVDVEEAPPIVKEKTIEKVVQTPPPPQFFVRGKVHEAGTGTAIAEAIVTVPGRGFGYATGADGKFETNNVEPGTYTFNVKAPGYKDGTCSATVVAGAAPAEALPPAPPQPGMEQPGMMPQPQPQPAAAPGQPNVPQLNYTDIDCPLEALPRMGNIQGRVVDADTQLGIAGASVVATDSQNKEYRASTDGAGAFRFEGVSPGNVSIKVEAEKFFAGAQTAEVKPREDSKPSISMSARPKTANVVVGAKEIQIKKQVHFETDSAQIKPDSSQLLAEVADVINKSTNIRRIEIQGHTDNTGSPDHNMQLSQARAESVKSWLVGRGVDASRLEARGYGQTRPRMPNVTAANRALNRRVQFIIVEKQ